MPAFKLGICISKRPINFRRNGREQICYQRYREQGRRRRRFRSRALWWPREVVDRVGAIHGVQLDRVARLAPAGKSSTRGEVEEVGRKGVAREEKGEIPPPRIPKNCCRKMVLFPKALFLVTNFRKK